MSKIEKFRPAVMADADLLLAWRNDSATRSQSINTDIVERSAHLAWLKSSLSTPNRQLSIAEVEGKPVGTVRADTSGEYANYRGLWHPRLAVKASGKRW